MFDPLLAEIQNQGRQFTVYEGDEESGIPSQFETHAVSVRQEELPPGGPAPFVVIEQDGEFAGALPVDELQKLIEPPIVRPGERTDVSEGFGVLFEVLDDTVFTAMNRKQLLAVSREIEDRATRVRTGTLRTSFQNRSRLEPQIELYRYLASHSDLDIHIYGIEPADASPIPGVTYHRGAQLDRYWSLAFDGGDHESQSCALVARETPNGYDGFWTYDPVLVDEILSTLADCDDSSR
ncbi:MAG: DICT sensory domain-containing protein [Halovenus sp.]